MYAKRIPASSPNKVKAELFAAELRRAMTHRGVSTRGLAAALGFRSSNSVNMWRTGDHLPRLDSAIRISEALDWPSILELVRKARTFRCMNPVCGQVRIDESPAVRRLYCDNRCAQQAKNIRNAQSTPERAATAERRLQEHREAVELMCRACEPEGYCRTADCPLRGVSPLPLARRSLSAGIAAVSSRPELVTAWAHRRSRERTREKATQKRKAAA